jgi:hypothetical protein
VGKIMKYFGLLESGKKALREEIYHPMAKSYWGVMPLPKGSKLIGGYQDTNSAGALIELANGNLVCGNAGSIKRVTL